MEGLDYLGADGTLRTLPRRIIPDRLVAVTSTGENEVPNPRRSAIIRRVTNGAMGVVIGAAYGSIVAGPFSMPFCALAGAVIGAAIPLNNAEPFAPIPVTSLPYRQPWRDEPRPSVALAKREPAEMPAAVPADSAERFGKLEVD